MKIIKKYLPLAMVGIMLLTGCTAKPSSTATDNPTVTPEAAVSEPCDTENQTGCDIGVGGKNHDKETAVSFKEEYETLNGKENAKGAIHRTIEIAEDNPFVISDGAQVMEKINNGDTFYIYIGDPLCPWCRSVVEKAIEVAEKNNVKEIYSIDIWDEDGKEIFRNKYEIVDGEAVETIKGDENYYLLVDKCADLAGDYLLEDSTGESKNVGKRLYAPSFIAVKDGRVVALETGISELQTGSRDELTAEILADEEAKFQAFFGTGE